MSEAVLAFLGSYRIKQYGTSCFALLVFVGARAAEINCAAQGCLSAVQVVAMLGVSVPESRVTMSAQSYLWASWSVYLQVLCGHSCAAVRLCMSRSTTEQCPGVWWYQFPKAMLMYSSCLLKDMS